MFDTKNVHLGIAPIGWCNDDMPELGAENTFKQTVSEMALAGFTGCEIGNKYPSDPVELKKQLDLRGMRIASRWFSSFLLTKPYEEVEADFIRELDFLAAVGANRINVSEQSYSIQGKVDVPILTGGHKYVMNDEEWDRFCDGLNKLGRVARERGFKLCFHHHMGTVVQTSEETDRMMSGTDPEVPLRLENHAAKGTRRLVERRAVMAKRKRPAVANCITARELACWVWSIGCMAEGTM